MFMSILSKENIRSFGASVLALGVFVLLWGVIAAIANSEAIPSPAAVYHEGVVMFSGKIGGNTMWAHAYYSMRRVIIAFLLAAATGLPLGIMMGWNKTFDKVVSPIFELLRPIPPIAWIPIAILWLGIGEGPKIFICYVGAFVIFVLNSYTGMRYTDTQLIDAARTYGASRREQLFHVAIPASLPSVFAGMQNALSMAWMCVLAAELVGAREGVGFIIIQGMNLDNPPMIVVGMITIGIIGILLAVSLRWLERILCPWRRELQ